ncbi:VOC family protein [Paenibacillus lautus]|uniref:VOC family protein n=1 Tax=Paenibacillus lautus TaxID=1401 RepID=UPI002DBAC346|nr:VOC family protein [Paenibacillus lautus]MEC0257998.1 VOC family protein [Paenibacillus lautus]
MERLTKPPLYGVGIFVPVSDLKRSTAWYTEMLGLEIIHRDEPDAIVMRMNDEKVSFCLVRSDEVKQPVFPNNNYGVGQYFNIHTTDVGGMHRLLKAKGADVGDIEDFDGFQGFSLMDPDGNRFGVTA